MTAALHELTLAEALDGADDEEIAAPETREHVDRLLGRLARVRAARDRDVADAEIRRAQIDAWLDARLAVHDNAARHIEAVLTAWHEHLLTLDERAKSISLPNGTLKSRAYGQTVKVTDEATFIAWASESAPALVRVKETRSVDRTALKEFPVVPTDDGLVVVDPATGEPLPGVEGVAGGRTFSVVLTEEVTL